MSVSNLFFMQNIFYVTAQVVFFYTSIFTSFVENFRILNTFYSCKLFFNPFQL